MKLIASFVILAIITAIAFLIPENAAAQNQAQINSISVVTSPYDTWAWPECDTVL